VILLWGLASESPLAQVRRELDNMGAPVLHVDQRVPHQACIELHVDVQVCGHVVVDGEANALQDISAAYIRPYPFNEVPAVVSAGAGSQEWQHAERLDHGLSLWVALTTALLVNPPSAMASNGSKPYQLRRIKAQGFSVPHTLVTTDPDAARAFWAQHESVIYKSVSGVRSIVSRLQPDDVDRLSDVQHCPTQFQAYVPGVDHRVHVVGSQVFAARVESEAVDYRYPAECSVEIRECRLPDDVADRCKRLATALRLPVAGIDLRRTPEGEWFCFEVNPSPAFTYYESATGQPIAAAIARFLVDGSDSLSHRERRCGQVAL
jgi:hypothetical protein